MFSQASSLTRAITQNSTLWKERVLQEFTTPLDLFAYDLGTTTAKAEQDWKRIFSLIQQSRNCWKRVQSRLVTP